MCERLAAVAANPRIAIQIASILFSSMHFAGGVKPNAEDSFPAAMIHLDIVAINRTIVRLAGGRRPAAAASAATRGTSRFQSRGIKSS